MKLEIEKAFLTEGRSTYDFFQRPGVGFYIPLYQREYSWDKDNVEQLIEDIEKGVTALTEPEGDNEIRFLGTIITVIEKDKGRIQPLDPQALPTAVEKLIDGQQRLSTIAFIGCLLYKYFRNIQAGIPEKSNHKAELSEVCQFWMEKLIDIFSFDLKRGEPKHKPKIIRGYIDEWTKDGNADTKYKSEIANYLARAIYAIEFDEMFPEIPKDKSNFTINAKIVDNWLKKVVTAHERNDDSSIPAAWDMLTRPQNHDFIWSYYREELKAIVDIKDTVSRKADSYIACSIVQLISVSHYLLERCCFTIIQPMNEDWAFDMFQSLNASGTPLTAIETFKPFVVNTTEQHEKYEYSTSKASFAKVEELFRDANNAAMKSKLTNEFLTSLAIVIDGDKLASHFSSQRKYLHRIYSEDLFDYKRKCQFVDFLGNYADFYKNIWLDYKGINDLAIDKINSNPEGGLASLLILFLKRSNHRMAVTILGCFYDRVLRGEENSISDFIEAVKAISAFYILWRACDSNAGIDNIYRNYFKGKDDEVSEHNWLKTTGQLNIQELKSYLRRSFFSNKGVGDRDEWVARSANYLKYDNSATICRIALIIASDDTIADSSHPGLMKPGTKNSSPYFNLSKWNSNDLKDIEHIAPQENRETWDQTLYDMNTKLYDTLGNLTLLPSKINSSAGNRGWKEKHIYYQHLGNNDPDKLKELASKAKVEGVVLSETTIKLLEDAQYNEHVLPILQVAPSEDWTSEIVLARTTRMLDLVWEKVINWL